MSELDVRCYIVGNGPALSPDGRLLYTVDPDTGGVLEIAGIGSAG